MIDELYPSEETLDQIQNHPLATRQDLMELLELIRSEWWMAETGFNLVGVNVLHLTLITGGWSGNESILQALQQHTLFMPMFWQKSIRGGRHYFRIPLKVLKNDGKQ